MAYFLTSSEKPGAEPRAADTQLPNRATWLAPKADDRRAQSTFCPLAQRSIAYLEKFRCTLLLVTLATTHVTNADFAQCWRMFDHGQAPLLHDQALTPRVLISSGQLATLRHAL